MAKLIKKFDDLVNNPTFAAGLVALAALSKNPKILATAIGTVGLNAASNVALGGGRTSSSTALNNANARENRLQLAQIKTGTTYRRLENEQLKKKTEVDKLAEKFDVERIGLMKALGEATDAETKLRIQSKLAILDNNEALAKKLLAEMEGTKATVELTTQFYALSEAAKALITSFGVDPSQVGPGGTIIGGLGGRSNIASLANTSINNPAFASSGAGMDLGLALGFTPGSRTGSAAPTEVIVTVNTAAGGDRLSQAIAESIQIATRNGYSTVPAGQGF
jgi:hypothetical protein